MADEQDLRAAERALGHAPTGGESPTETAAREAWENRLAPLLAFAPEIAPSAALLHRIETEITPASIPKTAQSTETTSIIKIADIAAARASARKWKGVAATFGAIAAALALYVAVPVQTEAPSEKYVAVVSADDGSGAGLIIQINGATGEATVIPVTTPPTGSSYEMWTIPQGQTTPVSLGLLPQEAVAHDGVIATDGQIFAISLEPEGGSPNGQPTQALFHGKAVRLD